MKNLFFVIFLFLFTINFQAQNLFLADQYLKDGEKEKALSIYLEWFEKHRQYNPEVYDQVLNIYIRKGEYDLALEWVEKNKRLSNNSFIFLTDRYHLYKLKNQDDKALKILFRLNSSIRNQPAYASVIHYRLKKYNYLDEAVQILKTANQVKPSAHYFILMGNTYAETGDAENMMENFLKSIELNDSYFFYLTGSLSKYIDQNPENKYNRILKQKLIQRISENSIPAHIKLLHWLYVRENNFRMAFVQLRALYLQELATIPEFLHLTESAIEKKDFDTAKEILEFIQLSENLKTIERDKLLLLLSVLEKETGTKNAVQKWKKRLPLIRSSKFRFALSEMIIDHLIYQEKKFDEARHILDSLQTKEYTGKILSVWKEKEADILLLEKKFDRAAIQYTLLRKDFPYEEINYRALYKIALASFFQGDFDWAHTNLKTLKKAADKKIANDALLLDFIIISNREKNDTLQTGLKTFAGIYFDYYARNYPKALKKIEETKNLFKGQKIYDDLIYLQARILEETGKFLQTRNLWEEILNIQTDKIYREEALYKLGIIFEKQGMSEKAKTYFKKVLTDYPQGFWYEKARKHFRKLIEKNQTRLP